MNFTEFTRHPVTKKMRMRLQPLLVFAKEHYQLLLIVFAVVTAFYWYEIRPVRVNRFCAVQASQDARSLLQSKAKIATDPAKKQSYVDLANQGMYLRTDYESFYTKCLRYYALDK